MFANLGDSKQQRGIHGRRPPPNYFSRSVRIRLFLLVSMVMLVLLAMSRVRDPGFWSFMGFDNNESARMADESLDDGVDSQRQTGARPTRAPDAFSAADPDGPAAKDEPEVIPRGTELEFNLQDGWQQVHGQLTYDQRELLHHVLKNARDGSSLSEEQLQAWTDLFAELEERWSQFHLTKKQAVDISATMPADEKQLWRQAYDKSESHWMAVKEALAAAAGGNQLSKAQSDMLRQTQQRLDAAELREVRDNTTLSRYREKNAWFRFFAQLDTMDQEDLIKQSSGRVSFLQLFRQPEQYRGKLVTIRGTARLAYHVPAPPNIYGIQGYYVFWVQPWGMSDKVINVYALETPPGFPEVKDKALGDRTKLFEEVEITGYFFKNYTYNTEAGSNIAPLVLAKVPTWEAQEHSEFNMPQTSYIILGVAVIALVAIGISVLAYVRSRNASPLVTGYGVSGRAKPNQLKELEKVNIMDVGQNLKQLAESESDSTGE